MNVMSIAFRIGRPYGFYCFLMTLHQLPTARITPQRLLNHERQSIKSLTHVGMAGRQPHPRAARHRDHRRRLPFASAFTSAATVGAST